MPEEYPATILFLIRHGQARASDGSYGPNTPLSELGRVQAEKIADVDVQACFMEKEKWRSMIVNRSLIILF